MVMREAWIIATFVAVLVLVAAPLSAQQRAQPTGAHVVACSGTFAKDSSHLKLAMFFDSKNITFTDVRPVTVAKSPLRYCSLMIRSVDSKCGGPIQPPVRIFI